MKQQTDPGSFSDLAVIRQVRDGDVNAFALLVDRHKENVARIVHSHVPADQVEEVAHDVFVRAYGSLHGYRAEQPFAHWLSVVAVRACQDFWRKEYRNKEQVLSDLSEHGMAWLDAVTGSSARMDYEDEQSQRDARTLLYWALDQLPDMDRMVLTLTSLEGYSVAETGKMLDASIASIKVRAMRARRKLRTILEGVMDSNEGIL